MHYNCELETGNVLIYFREPWNWKHPVEWISGLGISLFTWSSVVHAGIVVKGQLEGIQRTLVSDATPAGIEVRPLSADVAAGRKIAVLRIPTTAARPINWKRALAKTVFESWGVDFYGYITLLENAFVEISGIPRNVDPEEMPRRKMCSQWVSLLLRGSTWDHRRKTCFDPCPQFPDRWTTPADLWRKSQLKLVVPRLAFNPHPAGKTRISCNLHGK